MVEVDTPMEQHTTTDVIIDLTVDSDDEDPSVNPTTGPDTQTRMF